MNAQVNAMVKRGAAAGLFWLLLCVAAGAQHLPGWMHPKSADFRSFGTIIAFHLSEPLTLPPATTVANFPLQNFTYSLYPTASSGEDGMVPGDTGSGKPLEIQVRDGHYDHHTDPTPIDFEIIKGDVVPLPKAPGGSMLMVYSVLYTGDKSANCTGVVQLISGQPGHLVLTDQISYDCRGGAGAEWDQAKKKLTVRSARYAAGDQPCCPSIFDSVEFKIDGESVKIGQTTINQGGGESP